MPTRMPTHRNRDVNRPNAYQRGYCDKQHRAWRLAVLTRDAWQCQSCGRVCPTRGAHADHKLTVRERPDLRYNVSNGQCLCASCHSRKTVLESRGAC
jgi:5-methylcytosine-specific restriction endonuclease McrA